MRPNNVRHDEYSFVEYAPRVFLQVEDILANEPAELADGEPLTKIVIAAAIHDPFAGR